MVELRPSKVKLVASDNCPSADRFNEMTALLSLRPVDLITRNASDGKEWLNTENSVAFELRQASYSELTELACITGRLKPDEIDYMHSCGDQCIVYWMSWK